MGLRSPSHIIGFDGRIEGGPHDGSLIRIVADLRGAETGLVVVADEDGRESVISVDDVLALDAVVGGRVVWPSVEERARRSAMQLRRWFFDGPGLLEEPFAGAKLNAHPVQLIGCSVEEGRVVAEFTETWDVCLDDIRVLDVDAVSFGLLAEQVVLTSRHPGEAPSVSKLERIPFRWRRA